jgi:nitroreductase
VVALATRAPSVHNTQPWHFRAGEDVLDLYADRERQLAYLDPLGRQLTVSCGAALLFAQLALATSGLAYDVEVMPDPDDFDHFARIRCVGRRLPTQDEVVLADAIPRRSTARGPFTDAAIPAGLRGRLAVDAAAEGGWLRWIDAPADRTATAVLVTRATRIEEADPDYRAEIRRWRRDSSRDGVPTAALPEPPPRLRGLSVPLRDFEPGNGNGGNGVDAQHVPLHGEEPDLVVVGTDFDGPAGWLAAGRAMARVLLRVTAAGAAASPIGQVVDLPWTREQLRLRLDLLGHPQMLLRLGYTAATEAATPRRALQEVLDRVY